METNVSTAANAEHADTAPLTVAAQPAGDAPRDKVVADGASSAIVPSTGLSAADQPEPQSPQLNVISSSWDEPQPLLQSRTDPLRLLPHNLVDPEPFWKRRLFEIIALGITLAFFYFIASYWAPAHPGVDQNGYLVGGKQIALTGSSGFQPSNPFQYIGSMWVITGDPSDPHPWYYPKYPLGLPLLYAIPLWINWDAGKDWAFYVSPVCAALAVGGMFMMVRMVAGSFMGIMGMLLLGMNVTTLALANNPNSHASALCFVAWGMFMLLRWWQTGSLWRGLIAGFLIGYAATIRYTEGLLLLPLLAAVLFTIPYRQIVRVSWWRIAVCVGLTACATLLRFRFDNHGVGWIATGLALLTLAALVPVWHKWRAFTASQTWFGLLAAALGVAVILLKAPLQVALGHNAKNEFSLADSYDLQALIILGLTYIGLILFIYSPRDWKRSAVPVLGWLIPILWLVGFNWFAMHTITGYDTTNESSGFSMQDFQAKWEFMVKQLYDYGAFFMLPLTVLGLIAMWRWSVRIAIVAALWLLPGVLLYACYYWGLNARNGGMGYLRFFLTLVPAMILPATWFLRHGGWWRADAGEMNPRHGSIAMPIACGAFVAMISCMAIRNTLAMLERDVAMNNNLYFTGEQIVHTIPPGSIVFAEQGRGAGQILNYLQWKGDYELYAANAFTGRGGRGGRGMQADPDQPAPLQRARIVYLQEHVYKNKSPADLERERMELIRNALAEPTPRKSYALMPLAAGQNLAQLLARVISGEPMETKQVARWTEPAKVLVEAPETPLMPPNAGFQQNRPPMSWQIVEIKPQPVRGRGAAVAAPAVAPRGAGPAARGRGNAPNPQTPQPAPAASAPKAPPLPATALPKPAPTTAPATQKTAPVKPPPSTSPRVP